MAQDVAAIADLTTVILLVCIVSVAARSDLRDRSISQFMICAIILIAVVCLSVRWIVVEILPTESEVIMMCLSGAVLFVMLLGRVFIARGDIMIILITIILVPSVHGIPTIVIALAVAMIVSVIFHMSKTIIPNVLELARTRRIFAGVDDSVTRKAIAFFLIHKRTNKERFCFAGEATNCGRRHLILSLRSVDSADIEAKTEYVITAIPFMIPYLVGVCAVAGLVVLNVI